MGKKLRILVIGAHPADVFDNSGGTMTHHIERGDWVGCVVLTHGARVHDKEVGDRLFHCRKIPPAQELKKLMAKRSDVKAQEVVKACALLGVKDVYFMSWDDAILLVSPDTVRELAGVIRRLKPEIIITHFPKEDGGVGSSHAECGMIVMHAISLASAVDTGDRNPPHKIAQVFYFGGGAARVRGSVWNAEGGYYNDVLVDITDVINKKLSALDMMVSQGYGGDYARKRIETSDGSFGKEGHVPYAEGFISWKASVHYCLPLTETDIATSRESDHETIKRMSYRYLENPSVSPFIKVEKRGI